MSTLPLGQHTDLIALVARAIVDAEDAQQRCERLRRDESVLMAALFRGLTKDEERDVRHDLSRRIDRERLKRGAR
jgi:ADP-ribosylglycohydrolase